jgi:hypothetical protein
MNKESYLLLNKIFAGVILAIFLYSACYSPDSNAYPIQCIHEQLLGKRCPTCGMSHAFSALVRLQFDKAQILQPGALSIFLFFFIQLLQRVSAIILVRKPDISLKLIIRTDIVLSLILFLITFRQLIFSTLQIFYKVLISGTPG